jgi:hypothetical protein
MNALDLDCVDCVDMSVSGDVKIDEMDSLIFH